MSLPEGSTGFPLPHEVHTKASDEMRITAQTFHTLPPQYNLFLETYTF